MPNFFKLLQTCQPALSAPLPLDKGANYTLPYRPMQAILTKIRGKIPND
jgi:hypothetical protein